MEHEEGYHIFGNGQAGLYIPPLDGSEFASHESHSTAAPLVRSLAKSATRPRDASRSRAATARAAIADRYAANAERFQETFGTFSNLLANLHGKHGSMIQMISNLIITEHARTMQRNAERDSRTVRDEDTSDTFTEILATQGLPAEVIDEEPAEISVHDRARVRRERLASPENVAKRKALMERFDRAYAGSEVEEVLEFDAPFQETQLSLPLPELVAEMAPEPVKEIVEEIVRSTVGERTRTLDRISNGRSR